MLERPQSGPSRCRARALLAGLAVAAAAAMLPSPAAAAPVYLPPVIDQHDVPGGPGQLTTTADGAAWVALRNGADVARIGPDGVVSAFDAPSVFDATGIAVTPEGDVWVTQPGSVARFPASDRSAAEVFPVPDIGVAQAIVVGPDGNLWTVSGDRVIRIPPANPSAVTSFDVSPFDAQGIDADSEGHLWVSDAAGGRLIRMSTDGRFTIQDVGGSPHAVAVSREQRVAFVDAVSSPQRVGITAFNQTPLLAAFPGANPVGVTFVVGPPSGSPQPLPGMFWVAAPALDQVASVPEATSSQRMAIRFDPGSAPRFVADDPQGHLWVSLAGSRRVARITHPWSPGGPILPGCPEYPVCSFWPRDDQRREPPQQPAPRDTVAPAITGLTAQRRSFRAGPRLAPAKKGRSGVGTLIRFGLSEPAAVRLRVERIAAGRRRGTVCVASTAKLRHRRACTRYVRATVLDVAGKRGANAVTFRGLVPGRALPAGRYRVTVSAKDAAGNASIARRLQLRVLRR